MTDLKAVQPERPFFLYTSFGACHAPHQAPQAYLDKYRGFFDKGWDQWREDTLARQKAIGLVPENTQLPPRNMGVKAWDALKEDEKRLYCRFQEAFAAMLDHTDAQIRRLMDHLEEIGEFDNTLFILVSDNGASQEGGPNGAINEFSIFNGMFNTLEENMPLIKGKKLFWTAILEIFDFRLVIGGYWSSRVPYGRNDDQGHLQSQILRCAQDDMSKIEKIENLPERH